MNWQPIESAPHNAERVIVCWGEESLKGIGEAYFSIFHKKWFRPMGSFVEINPTHWMPLPEPPQ